MGARGSGVFSLERCLKFVKMRRESIFVRFLVFFSLKTFCPFDILVSSFQSLISGQWSFIFSSFSFFSMLSMWPILSYKENSPF